jgi:uncharacterized protein (DUF1800 family)
LAALNDVRARTTLAKLTYGYTPTDVASLKALGLEEWLKDQLSPRKLETSEYLQDISMFRSQTMSLPQIYQDRLFKGKPSLLSNELAHLTLIRRLYSSRQVFEMLVEHFSDYVPVPLLAKKSLVRADYDNTVIRSNALGYFPNLLAAATYHPAMLDYLNGDTNTAQHPNENYGREFLELFTLTPSAGYTEDDVKGASKMFSGIVWDVATDQHHVRLSQHYFGPISVFGYTDKNKRTDSEAAVKIRIKRFINHIALRPETAKAFSIRMARRFVADAPPNSLIKKMSAEYLRTKGHIPSVFKVMALSTEFAAAKPTKVKRPMEHLASTVRALNVPLANPVPQPNLEVVKDYAKGSPMPPVLAALTTQGHAPFDWPFPNGYPDVGELWTTLSSQVQRWNLSGKIAQGKMPVAFADPNFTSILSPTSASATEIVTDLAIHFYGADLPATEKTKVLAIINQSVRNNADQAKYIANVAATASALLLSKPDWNLR